MLLRLLHDDSGQDLIEYALLASIVALTGAGIFTVISGKMGTAYASWITGARDAWQPCAPGVTPPCP